MIPLGGIGTGLAVKLFDSTREKQLDLIEHDALNARQIAAFSERIATIGSAKELIADTEVYTFVMRAFDLKDQIFGKALIRKTLESDIADRGALVNRLTDPRIRAMYEALGFVPDGGPSANFADAEWQQGMIERFKERILINSASEDNTGAGLALEFRSKAAGIETWMDVLKDEDLGKFMRRALGLPDEMVKVDIDRQAALFAQKFDIEKLKDPAEVDRLVARFSAIYDAIEGTAVQSNAAVLLMEGAVSAGQGGGFSVITADIPSIIQNGYGRYR